MKMLMPLLLCCFLCGCITIVYSKHTLRLPEHSAYHVKASKLVVRMGGDLRAYTSSPLIFHSDGTVTRYRALTYYAPIDTIVESVLSKASQFTGTTPLRISLERFCIEEGAEGARVSVRLSIPNAPASEAVQPLPENYDAATVATALARALSEAYISIIR
ncbi:MAG: hypothetical protein RR268_02420 [Kiritimatiellia bacterium]